MPKVYLGLGSNLGDRLANLEKAVRSFRDQNGISNIRLSSLIETAPLLPENFETDWNLPFLNLVMELDFLGSPRDLLSIAQKIENEMGRKLRQKWAPREIDIDILLFDEIQIDEVDLKIPHPEILNRSFVINPLSELKSELKLRGVSVHLKEIQGRFQDRRSRIMGILNATPDSFSDGSVDFLKALKEKIDLWERNPVSILDIGGESTRPGARPIGAEEEWARVFPILTMLKEKFYHRQIKPKISFDTRHPENVIRAIPLGVDILNDVNSVRDPKMLEALLQMDAQIVLMHSLSVPADPKMALKSEVSAAVQIYHWFESKLEELEKNGIDSSRFILDPGIGFGKNALQSYQILKEVSIFKKFQLPILIGHSRKSFLKKKADRDSETLALSLHLMDQGVDYLRVHDTQSHWSAMLTRSYLS